MGTNLHDVYYCQMDRTQQLSNRLFDRNLPSHQMGQSYFARPVDTYATVFPILDCHKPSTVNKAEFPEYNQQLMFNPGQSAPYEGYSNNVDVESKLHNSFHPTQKCVQSKYIPNSRSDMYNANYLIPASNPVRMTNNLLFKKTQFNSFNPNQCNLGHKVFNNHIRIQTKNIELTSENTVGTEENK
tara:strand:+ start:776 stop:1330 length:555 start_codon:yes stop_codon:yes gene_type:complete